MSLRIGSQVTAETLGWQLTIEKKLGEGGQGVAYVASGPGGEFVVKWYNAEQATDAQRQAIRQLVKDEPPTGVAGKRFVWPLDVVTAPQSRQFGYLMSVIDTQRFAKLGEVCGTMEYMAPELIREEATPSTETDLHSLAVLQLSRTTKLRQRHVDPFATNDVAETIIGEVAQNSTSLSAWGLRNLSSTPWVATSVDGLTKEIPPQKATSLQAGLKLNVAGVVAEVQQ